MMISYIGLGGGALVSSLATWQVGTSPSRLTYTITAGLPHAHVSPGRGLAWQT
jgi:hypothetical protein